MFQKELMHLYPFINYN